MNGETGPEQWTAVVQGWPCREVETMVARPPCASILFTPYLPSEAPAQAWLAPTRPFTGELHPAYTGATGAHAVP